MVGEQIGNFRVTARLGEGGMGIVYVAEHPVLGRRVAVKVLHPAASGNEGVIQRFFNEARAANAVGHPGIVEALDLGLLPSGAPYIVMELLEGESVAARLRRMGRLAISEAIAIADQAADILGAAHAKGIVHRDLKTDHLFLAKVPAKVPAIVPAQAGGGTRQPPEGETVKILDFGIAKLAQTMLGDPLTESAPVRTRTGTVMGTPHYMSPEQCRDARDVDHRADIYSLGIVLHEMLAGAPPFSSHSWGELVYNHISVPPPPLRSLRPDVPADLETVVLKALEKDPNDRFQSMMELRAALSRLGLTQPAGELAPPVGTGQSNLWERPGPGGIGSTIRLDAREEPRLPNPTTLSSAAMATERSDAQRPAPRRRLVLAAAVSSLAVAIAAGMLMASKQPAKTSVEGPSEPPSAEFPSVAASAGPRSPQSPENTTGPSGPATDSSGTAASRSGTAAVPSGSALATAPAETRRPEDTVPPAGPEPPAPITVDIETEPPGTRVVRERDGATMGVTPLHLSWPRATGQEALTLEREGYQRKRLTVPLDSGLTARLHLEPLPKRVPRRAPGGQVTAPRTDERPSSSRAATKKPAPPAPSKREPLKI